MQKAARDTIRAVLCEGGLPTRPEVGVRLNSVESGMCEEDLAAILSADHLPPTLLLPKVDSKEHLQWVSNIHVSISRDYVVVDVLKCTIKKRNITKFHVKKFLVAKFQERF